MKIRLLLGAALAALVVAVVSAQAPATQTFDLLVRNGRVLDGTGNPWYPADIGVRDGRIVAVGTLTGAQAARVIDELAERLDRNIPAAQVLDEGFRKLSR